MIWQALRWIESRDFDCWLVITTSTTTILVGSQDNLDKPVPECLHSRFYLNKNDSSGSDSQSYKMCKTPVKRSLPTNQQYTQGLQAGCPGSVTQPAMPEHRNPWTCSPIQTGGFPSLS